MNKNNEKKGLYIMTVFTFIYLITQIISLNGQVSSLRDDLRYQNHQLSQLVVAVEELKNANKVVKSSRYKVEAVNDQTPFVECSLELEFSKSFQEPVTLYYKESASEIWNKYIIDQTSAETEISLKLNRQKNYELKMGYTYDGHEYFESLPQLDLYSKDSQSWQSDIVTTSVEKETIEFNVQLAHLKTSLEVPLLEAICEVYYDDVLIESFDVKSFMEENDQKPLKAQIEHDSSDRYWFARRVLAIPTNETIQAERVRYELMIKNAQETIFYRTYFID